MKEEVTITDFEKIVQQLYASGGIREPYEASYAVLSGWNFVEFRRLYAAYICSTQVDLRLNGNQTTAAKGNPLEDVARYFLEKGGIAKYVKSGGVANKWTVDGMGETYPDRLDRMLGSESSQKYGPKLYMEAKNHSDVMSPEDWAQHCSRMKNHGCKLGVAFSTCGYPMSYGKGYADDIFHDWLRGVLHLLLSVDDLRSVAQDGHFPWAVMRAAFIRTTDQAYETSDVQRRYSRAACEAVAKAEYSRVLST